MQTNTKPQKIYTHNGAIAKKISPEQQLRRSVMSCLLWENEFYEDGETIASRIGELVPLVEPVKVAEIAISARTDMGIRHAPLKIVREMVKHYRNSPLISDTLKKVIQRADELSEFMAMYFEDGKKPIAHQVKKGLASAFNKFDRYHLARNLAENKAITLRDVMFLVHPKPINDEQAEIFKGIANRTLSLNANETWQMSLSAQDGRGKQEKWTEALKSKRLGTLDIIRNLRNMIENNVDESLIRSALQRANPTKALPFQFITASKYAPSLESELEELMLSCLNKLDKLGGKTVILVDVSGSMEEKLSSNSDTSRLDVACGLAILIREICEHADIFTFSNDLVRIPNRRGFALRDAILNSQDHNATFLGSAVKAIYSKTDVNHEFYHFSRKYLLKFKGFGLNPNRIIVITDEQSNDSVPDPQGLGYMINIASAKNGVGYYSWLHINGWSEAVIRFIQNYEASEIKD